MKRTAQVISVLALAATLLPALLFFANVVDLQEVQFWMVPPTLAWFLTAPLWMEHKTGK